MPAPPRRSWGLWLAGAGGALALVAGVAVATGQGLPFGERSADRDGDGMVSESELRAELAAIPRIETGRWQVSIEHRETGRQARHETHDMDVVQGHPFELIWKQNKYEEKSENMIADFINICAVNHLNFKGNSYSGSADCNDRGEAFHISLDGLINKQSASFSFKVTGEVEGGASLDFSAKKIL